MRHPLPAALPAALLAATAVAAAAVPSGAANPPSSTLSRSGQKVTWSGTLTVADPMGCGEVLSHGCDTTPLTVVARKGTWITVGIDKDQSSYIRVTDGTAYVAGNGYNSGLASTGSSDPVTTFQQVRDGKVVYTVGVSTEVATPATPFAYHVTAVLAGSGFAREGQCFVGGLGVDHVNDPDSGEPLHLSVMLVAAPGDVAEVTHVVAPALVETYARIGVTVRVRVQAFDLKPVGSYPFEQVRAAFHGRRPPGIDVVHVLSDNFAGGFAACIGGISYPEKAFSTGSLHYATEGLVPNPTVRAAAIAAHEIGHLLGAQHQQSNCVEALPQEARQPASDGSVGPCTEMNASASTISETFSTLERATIRAYVRRWAGR